MSTKAPLRRQPVSIAEAAEYLGVSTKTIRRYIAAGRLTGYRTGPRLLRVDHNELDGLMRRVPAAIPGGGGVA